MITDVCPVCGAQFLFKEGKKYCSRKCQKKVADRRHDAKRQAKQSDKAQRFREKNPTYDRDRMRLLREKYGRNDGPYAQFIKDEANPIEVESDAFIDAGDWHILYNHSGLCQLMLDTANDYGIHDIFIPGDFWDSDAYSKWPKDGYRSDFPSEVEQVGMWLDILTQNFDRVFFCKGNHENRVMLMNPGNFNMKLLFQLTGITEGYEVTNDNYMTVHVGDDKWILVHPPQFRRIPLSIARDMAGKYLCNVISHHGHFFGQGYDRSGRYYILDGGGMFDPQCLGYLRKYNTTPWVSNGFYVIDESGYIPFDLGRER